MEELPDEVVLPEYDIPEDKVIFVCLLFGNIRFIVVRTCTSGSINGLVTNRIVF